MRAPVLRRVHDLVRLDDAPVHLLEPAEGRRVADCACIHGFVLIEALDEPMSERIGAITGGGPSDGPPVLTEVSDNRTLSS